MPTRFHDLFDEHTIFSYLRQCRVVNKLVERENVHVPPTPEEVQELMVYLQSQGVRPVIVGSVAVMHHLGPDATANNFRPTVDMDVWVSKPPAPLAGWKRDLGAPGVISWISPSGGYVDFLISGQELPGGVKTPAKIEVDPATSKTLPVASAVQILKMKLNSMREKDLADAIALVRKLGAVPPLAGLNSTQRENLGLVQQWFQMRPTGAYGESIRRDA